MFFHRLRLLPALLVVLAGLILPVSAAAEISVPPVDPPNQPNGKQLGRVLTIARQQLRMNVAERKGNNVPRYRNGKGAIAPFSIHDQWCAAFSTWVWNRAGFRAYRRPNGAKYIWRSFDGTPVAVQVTDLSNWAMKTGRWSPRAVPGYLVAYDFSHIGVVIRANRRGQAVRSIEGNKGDRVRLVQVPMANVTGYISPLRLAGRQIINAVANPDMEVPAAIADDPRGFVEDPAPIAEQLHPETGFSGPEPAVGLPGGN